MIPLDLTTRKLQAFLSGAAATTNPTVTVFYYDVPRGSKTDNSEYLRFSFYTPTNGTNEVDVCAAPTQVGTIRNIEEIHVYNGDTAAITVALCVDDGGTNRIIVKQTLNVAETLAYSHTMGWYII